MLFGIDYARQAIWERRQKAAEKAQKDLEKAREEGIEEGRQEGIDQGYKLGYEAGVSDERLRRNGNGHDWMFGGPDDYR